MALQPTRMQLPLSVLLDQQLWFLGHDIRHAGGNALQGFGFLRSPSVEAGGTTCYRLPLDQHRAVVCWGFGAYCGAVFDVPAVGVERVDEGNPGEAGETCPDARGGVMFQRHTRAARLIDHPLPMPLHRLAELPSARIARTVLDVQALHCGLRILADTFVRYERWARTTVGDAYRLHTLTKLPRHKQKRFARMSNLGPLWERIVPSCAEDSPTGIPQNNTGHRVEAMAGLLDSRCRSGPERS